MKRFTTSHLRQMLSTEEHMLRSMMPTVSASDPTPLNRRCDDVPQVVAPLTVTLADAISH
jgi:hypothetical protein